MNQFDINLNDANDECFTKAIDQLFLNEEVGLFKGIENDSLFFSNDDGVYANEYKLERQAAISQFQGNNGLGLPSSPPPIAYSAPISISPPFYPNQPFAFAANKRYVEGIDCTSINRPEPKRICTRSKPILSRAINSSCRHCHECNNNGFEDEKINVENDLKSKKPLKRFRKVSSRLDKDKDDDYECSSEETMPLSIPTNSKKKKRNYENKQIYVGVTYHATLSKFRARIKINGKTTHLGYFNTAIEAAIGYDRAAYELRGLSAVANFKNSEAILQYPLPDHYESLSSKERCVYAARTAIGIDHQI